MLENMDECNLVTEEFKYEVSMCVGWTKLTSKAPRMVEQLNGDGSAEKASTNIILRQALLPPRHLINCEREERW